MKTLLGFIILLLLPLFWRCTSTDSSDTEKYLTAGIWYEEEHWLDDDGDGVLTLNTYQDDCNKDDEFHFDAGGAFSFNDGTNLCEPAFPVAVSGTWELRDKNEKLHIELSFSSSDPLDFEILEVSETRLVLNTIFPGDTTAQLPFEKIVLRR